MGAIKKCNTAGVDVRMVTGDNIDTAVAISKQCGILRPGIDLEENGDVKQYRAMAGPDFRARVLKADGEIDRAKFDEIWPHLRVLARSSPTDKYTLVSGIIESDLFKNPDKVKELGIYPDRQVVAVTGDGTNDAPALKRADIGFVMGITGTSVAKDASDIIITDDDFASIVQACQWGRNVYDSISKFLQFQLTVNISAVTLCLLGVLIDGKTPLRAAQLLWVNMIMDSLGALALASEPPVPEQMKRPPYGRHKGLLSRPMRVNMIGQSIYQLIVLLGILLLGAGPTPGGGGVAECKNGAVCDVADPRYDVLEKYWFCDVRDVSVEAGYEGSLDMCPHCGGLFDLPSGRNRAYIDEPTQHFTLIFNVFVYLQLFNFFNCRRLRHEWNAFENVSKSRTFLIVWVFCAVVQFLLVEGMGLGSLSSELELNCDSQNHAMRTVHLSLEQWVLTMLLGAGSIVWQWVLIAVSNLIWDGGAPEGEAGANAVACRRTMPVPISNATD